MLKIFFATFFIAELIIALAVILNIYRFNKKVNALNKAVLTSQSKIKACFSDLRFIFNEFNKGFLELKEIIKKKREEYLIRIIKNSLIYGGFFCLKGKYKKIILAYQAAKEIYEGFQES